LFSFSLDFQAYTRRLMEHRSFLASYLECNYSLLHKLKSKHVFTQSQLSEIWSLTANLKPYEQNEKLILLMKTLDNRKSRKMLFNIVNETHQKLLVRNLGDYKHLISLFYVWGLWNMHIDPSFCYSCLIFNCL